MTTGTLLGLTGQLLGAQQRPVRNQTAADAAEAPLLAARVVRSTASGWLVADTESPTEMFEIRGYVRLLVESAAESQRSIPAGTLVLAVRRAGSYVLLGSPGLYS